MSRYYTRTFVGLALVLLAIAAAAVLSNRAAAEAKRRYRALLDESVGSRGTREEERRKLQELREAVAPMREFAFAWRDVARLPEKDTADRIRSDLETVAQRQLGLVTDNAITPQPDRFLFQGTPMRVQRVMLRASGKDLVALMTWLGKVEEKYPAALIEGCDFASNVGGSTGLTVRLLQPLIETGPKRWAALPTPEQAPAPDAVAAIRWKDYLPARVKAPVAIGFTRNPLQPAVAPDKQIGPLVRDASDEISPRIESALDGRLRSVIRGAAPIIVVDGRVFRTGDELVVGAGRERPVPEARTRLKEITDDRLVFHVAGGTADKPIQCDVTYNLPAFLKAR